MHAEEDPLFVHIVDGSAPKSAIQSTVRARSLSSATSPPTYTAALDVPRPQSPFAIVSSPSQSSLSFRPPSRIEPRRCYSANDTEQVKPSPFSGRALAQVAAAPHQSFYAVGRGWKKGIYTTKDQAERQIRNFPGPLLQVFSDRTAAEDFLANAGRFTPQPPIQDEADDELLERTRIFNGLDPNSEFARRRTVSMSAERKEAQRRSRILIASQSVSRQEAAAAAVHSPPLSLRSIFSDAAPISPIEEINGFGSFPTPVPLQSMSLLPAKHLASSVAFYAKVLGFTCISQVPDVQAVMSSSSATICLRTLDHAPPPPTGANVSRMSMIRAPSFNGSAARSDPLSLGRPALPTMSEEQPDQTDETLSLPPTPESVSLSCTNPEPLDLPSTTLPLRSSATSTLSGQTVLIEYSGALEAMHTLLSAKLNEWRLERTKAAAAQASQTKGTQRSQPDMARILSGVQQTPWDAQELHLCDLDGHRIIYTTPFARPIVGASLI
ncbi:hypothetical protein NDA16_000760 [Ustilago loliicola]|nr:hypothetical protein NDA16_000760 [Ustilago loliicola]